MNYSREVQPSCCSKEQYEAENRKHWYDILDNKPANGQCVVMLFMNGTKDPDFWTTDIGYYCNDGFYKLEYDPTLDVMRKIYVNKPVSYWSNYMVWDTSEVIPW